MKARNDFTSLHKGKEIKKPFGLIGIYRYILAGCLTRSNRVRNSTKKHLRH